MNRIDKIVILIAEEAAERGDSGNDVRDVYSVCMEIDKRIISIMIELNKQIGKL